MSPDDREEFLPPMVLRQTKVGGASIKTTDHPSYMQALQQYPEDTGARSSTDAAPRRYPVNDRHRHHGDDNTWVNHVTRSREVPYRDAHPWHEDTRGDHKWTDASRYGREHDRYHR